MQNVDTGLGHTTWLVTTDWVRECQNQSHQGWTEDMSVISNRTWREHSTLGNRKVIQEDPPKKYEMYTEATGSNGCSLLRFCL